MHSSLISIGKYSLSYSLSDPPPSHEHEPNNHHHDPLLVIIPGAGDAASSYVAVNRLLHPSTQILCYDRSGLGRSEKGPDPPNAVRAAKDLHCLLSALNITNRLILLAHSYGGIIAREFLSLYPDLVAGMVLCDASTERASEFFSIPDPNIAAVLGDLKFAAVTGLRRDTVLSDDEWRARAKDIYAGLETAHAEAAAFGEVCASLKAKQQIRNQALGNRPLSVIRANTARDYQRVYQAGVEAGKGDEEQRRAFREVLGVWEEVDQMMQEEQLGLSGLSRFVRLEDCGHNVHLIRPDVIAGEVRWVRERVLEDIERSRVDL
ncbi:Alpha/Beta hydrolase protein [Aspergillus crustosus]